MPRRKESGIAEGLRDALAYAKGEDVQVRVTEVRIPMPDVKAIRKKAKLTQQDFAATFGFSYGAIRDWEQGRHKPEPVACALLWLIDRDPGYVRATLDRHRPTQNVVRDDFKKAKADKNPSVKRRGKNATGSTETRTL